MTTNHTNPASRTKEERKMVADNPSPARVCSTHEHVVKSLERQESILEEFRKENSLFKEKIAEFVGDICAQLKVINEIKVTQIDNMRRREDFSRNCEMERASLHVKINKSKEEVIAKIDKDVKEVDDKVVILTSRLDILNGGLRVAVVISSGVGSVVGAIVAGVIIWLVKSS